MAFWTVCDLGFAVGLTTYDVPRLGSLVWMAEPGFDEPRLEEVGAIDRWRWPVFFPLSAVIRRKIVTPRGTFRSPTSSKPSPLMRDGNR